MPVHPPKLIAGEEPTYTRSVFKAILDGLGWDDDGKSQYVLSEDGARVKAVDTAGSLAWHPWCEVMTPGSPNPLDEPWLRFPFTARQLAALMADGWGYFIQERYGCWQNGPDEDELLSIGQLGGKAKEALTATYAAYRYAVELAPRLDGNLAVKASELGQQYDAAREAAMERERLREPGLPDAEYTARLARVNAAVADLKQPMKEARQTADLAYSHWRRAVVQHLLLPIEEVSAESFECLMLRALPPDRRAEAHHQIQVQQAFQDSDEGKAHWDLVCEQGRVEAEVRRWQLMQPQTVTEAVLHDAKLKELSAELTTISDRMGWIEGKWRTAPSLVAAALTDPADMPLDPVVQQSEASALRSAPTVAAIADGEVDPTGGVEAYDKQSTVRRRTWRDVAKPYMVEKLRGGRFATAVALNHAMHEEAGSAESPFDKGEGRHRGSLWVREISAPLALKTIQNSWAELQDAASSCHL